MDEEAPPSVLLLIVLLLPYSKRIETPRLLLFVVLSAGTGEILTIIPLSDHLFPFLFTAKRNKFACGFIHFHSEFISPVVVIRIDVLCLLTIEEI